MKKFKLNFGFLFALAVIVGFMSSCGGDDGCDIEKFEGTFVGKYAVIGIEFPFADTVTITALGDDSLMLESTLLRTSFNVYFDTDLREGYVEDLEIDTLYVGAAYFSDIVVDNGSVRLDASCNNIYFNLNKASITDGTINIPLRDPDYPLNVNLTTAGNGLIRQ